MCTSPDRGGREQHGGFTRSGFTVVGGYVVRVLPGELDAELFERLTEKVRA